MMRPSEIEVCIIVVPCRRKALVLYRFSHMHIAFNHPSFSSVKLLAQAQNIATGPFFLSICPWIQSKLSPFDTLTLIAVKELLLCSSMAGFTIDATESGLMLGEAL